jgi:hypothetical protein
LHKKLSSLKKTGGRMEIKIREAVHDDVGFIVASWDKSAREARDREISQGTFKANYHHIIKRAVESADIYVACDPDESDHILGYAVVRDDCLLFCYTKYALRRQGIQKELLKNKVKSFASKPIWYNKNRDINLVYNPYPLYF